MTTDRNTQGALHTKSSRLKTLYVVVARATHLFNNKENVKFAEEEFFEWAYENNYESVFFKWAATDFKPEYLPVVGLLHKDEGWVLSNMRLVAMRDIISECDITSSAKAEKNTREESKYGEDPLKD